MTPPPVALPEPSSGPGTQAVCLIVLTVLAVCFTLKVASALLLPFVLAAVLNLVLQPGKHLLHKRLGLPAPLAALLLLLALFGVAGAVGAAISVPASDWIARAPQGVHVLEQRLKGLAGPVQYVDQAVRRLEGLLSNPTGEAEGKQNGGGNGGANSGQSGGGGGGGGSGGGGGGNLMSTLSGFGMTLLQGTGFALGQMLTLLVVLFFLLASGNTVMRRLVEVMPSFEDKRRVVEITQEIERNVAGYLLTISLMNALVGIANGVSMWLFGVADPLLWGTLAFLLNYVPILGPFMGIVIFFFVGLFSFSNIWMALVPAGIYLLIHVMEGETITPMLLANRFTLNPVLVIASLFFWDYMWGVIGALLAFPLLAVAKIISDRIETLAPLGHLLGGPPKADRDARHGPASLSG